MTFTGSVEDRLALRELLDVYADAVCRCDAGAWGETWAEDGEWVLPGYGCFNGKAQIVQTWRAAMTGFPGIVFRAWPGSIEVVGEAATMRSYTAESYERDGRTHLDLGRYDDRCVKRDGRWLFLRRAFAPLQRPIGGA